MSLDRLLWNRIICNKISQYWINFDWLFFFRVQYDHDCLKLFYESMMKNVDVRFNSSISTFINSHEVLSSFFFLCQLHLHQIISIILFFLFNDSWSSQTRHVKKSWRLVDYCFIQTSFNSSRHYWELWCFKSFFFRCCFLTKTIKVEVKSICVNSRTSFFTKHQLLIFKIWKKTCSRCREFNQV